MHMNIDLDACMQLCLFVYLHVYKSNMCLCVITVQVNEAAGLSPGVHTQAYADKCNKKRLLGQQKRQLPSTKRRRLILKQERAINQIASESLLESSYHSG